MGKISLDIDFDVVENLKQRLNELGLNELFTTLDCLVNYVKEQVNNKLPLNSSLSDDEYNRKMTIINRKFRHMLDVPMLCIDRIYQKEYPHETAKLLMIVVILHDIGRIDEIIEVAPKDFSTGKVNHAAIGAHYLTQVDKGSKISNIFKFVPTYLVDTYGDLIIACVRHHSDLFVPEGVFTSDLGKTLIDDLRMLDKVAIMNSFLVEDMSTVIQISLEELSKLSIDDYSFEKVMSCQPIDMNRNEAEKTRIRHFLKHVCFIFDLPEDGFNYLEPDWVEMYMDMYKPEKIKDQERCRHIVDKTKEYMISKGYKPGKRNCRNRIINNEKSQ